MFIYILRRLLATIPVMLIVAVLVFLMLRLSPSDPAAIIAGDSATSEQVTEIRKRLGLDQPIVTQFVIWGNKTLRGDFGESFFFKKQVAELIGERLEPTLSLAVVTLILAMGIAIPLGVLAAYRHGGWFDRKGCCVFNLYRPPMVKPIAGSADRWLAHIDRLYGAEHAAHIVRWCAHRVQKPADKINHALVLGGKQGIGKDTLLEPVKHAVGAWNFIEVSPKQVLGRFNGFLKSVILRVSEARDLGDAFHRLERVTKIPILEGAQLGQIVLPRFIDERVLENPADAGRVRTDHWIHAFRERAADRVQIFDHARARPIDVGPVLKNHVDERLPEHRFAPNEFHFRRGDELGRNRIGDLVFDQVGGASFPVGVDNHLRVAQVGNGIERRSLDRPDTGHDAEEDEDDDEQLVARARRDHPFDEGPAAWFFGIAVSVHHDFSAPWIFDSASIRKLALATTRSPSFRPLFTA
jgi:hypothetical protein